MDCTTIRQKAAEWMIERGWKRITAKRGGFNQSLFEHTIYELDSLFVLWPILSRSWGLNEADLASLVVGAVAHDVGKETPEWQQYVLSESGKAPYTPHVVEDLTQAAVNALFQVLGLEGSADDAKAFVRYHMQATRTADSLLFDAIHKGDKTDRWMTLSKIVDQIDNVCSANGLLAAIQALEKPPLGKHLKTAYHLVQIRGVSTTLLHRAAIEAYEAACWSPLLHYSNGTLYVASSASAVKEVALDDIETHLAALIETAMGKEFANAVVTKDFRASAIGMPPLFDYREIREYLAKAAERVGGGENRFTKRIASPSTRPSVEKMVRSYLGFCTGEKVSTVDEATLVRESQRSSRAYPEMCVFKFFKAALDAALIGKVVTPEAQLAYAALLPLPEKGKKPRAVTPQAVAQVEYNKVFGSGAFESLQKTSTLQPARDMAFSVNYYWAHDGHEFGLATDKVEFAPDDKRQKALVDALTQIAHIVYKCVPPENRPTRASTMEIARHFLLDLLHPSVRQDLVALVNDQLAVYEDSKSAAKNPRGEAHLCPICNTRFGASLSAKAAYLDKPESHTNRAVSHGSPGYIVICPACKYERFIQQLLLGGKPAEMLVLMPRMNIGQGSGAALVQKAHELLNQAMIQMSSDAEDPNEHISLALTQMIARKLGDQDVFRLSAQEILDLFTYAAADKTRKKTRKKLVDALRDEFGDTVDDLNVSWDTDFPTWDDAVEALIARQVTHDTAISIRAEVYKLQPTLHIVCQTPHLVLVPLLYPMAVGKDAQVNKAIRELFALLILGLAMDCSVAVLNSGEAITFEGGEGVALVPRVPALRDLVDSEWVGLDRAEAWLKAIGAASLLAQATGLPERSNLYQILSAPTPGHILRRIEQTSESGMVNYRQLEYLETLKEVLR
ncbi:MAG: hypothetical protein SXV54_15105 [Chloroflexota bacterium]|nr:hypothetical protein [Chloroflexota bacterium]